MDTAKALLCRFYGFSEKEVLAMTIKKFNGMMKQAGIISKMESGEDKEEGSLTGEQGAMLAQRIFKRGKL